MRVLFAGVGVIALVVAFSHESGAQSVNWYDQVPRQRPSDNSYRSLPQNVPAPATHGYYEPYMADGGQTQESLAQFGVPYEVVETQPSFDEENVASWQLLPDGLVYKSYLAGTQEPRLAMHMIDINSEGAHLDGFLGSRVPLLRFGTRDPIRPEGIQIDVEGIAHVRIDLADRQIVDAADFRPCHCILTPPGAKTKT